MAQRLFLCGKNACLKKPLSAGIVTYSDGFKNSLASYSSGLAGL